MQIREKGRASSVEVHGIYWAEYRGNVERYHLIVPEPGYPGLLSVPASDCEVVDASLDGLVLTKDTRGKDAFMHPMLLDREFLDQLIEHDEGAMEKFIAELNKK
ncbi:hypothetical protein [Ruegeria atlantica]|uniref:hypothetical protein n=1 Tax=Ruegeria atlantica TaxID=81569 RepID=UPI00147E62BF|nr:hypothetical protein [Ruegeria atlantica]